MNDIYMIGNAHLDPAWMWRLDEGFEAFLATCRSALDRMVETPDFIFTASSAAHYEFVEKTDPPLFKRIQEAVKNGRWHIVGGWWVESDCNLPSGESFIRQGLYGQQYFLSRFGSICKTGFCVDSFGHNANLPQLLRHCDMTNYVFMRPEEHEKSLDDVLFRWSSRSGDDIIAYRLPLHYSNFALSVSEKIDQLPSYPLFKSHKQWMLFYGVGNHGGGPTKKQIEQIVDQRSTNQNFGVKFSSPDTFFNTVHATDLIAIKGEMQPHAIGCYSAHSEIKQLCRKAENALLRAEKFCTMAMLNVPDFSMQSEGFHQAWKNVLLNSFHDVLGGVAIKEACDDAISLYHESLAIAARQERNAIQTISNNINTEGSVESLIIFNPHSWSVFSLVEFELWNPTASEKGKILQYVTLVTEDGRCLPTQKVATSGKIGEDRARFIAQVDVPAFGWQALKIVRDSDFAKPRSSLKATENILSNGVCGILFTGEQLPEQHVRYTPAQVFADESDTWGHGINGFLEKRGLFKVDRVVVMERGPIRAKVRVESSYGNSKIEEEFTLTEGADFIDQHVYLDWREPNFVLKLRYSHGCDAPKVIYEIPYSIIERPISQDEVPGGSWAFIQGATQGFGLINDSKSSYSTDEKYFYLTCARSPLYAHHAPPHTHVQNEKKRYLDQGEQEFRTQIIPSTNTWQAEDMPRRTLNFLQTQVTHIESAHRGKLTISHNGMEVSVDNVLVTVLKASYSGKEGKIVVRALETSGLPIKAMFQIRPDGAKWSAMFSAFELKTFAIDMGNVIETNGLEFSDPTKIF